MDNEKKKSKFDFWVKLTLRAGATLIVLSLLYCTVCYSNIPFISKWRTIYIETAMSTMTHQWLATIVFPDNVINQVMFEVDSDFKDNMVDESSLPDSNKDDNKQSDNIKNTIADIIYNKKFGTKDLIEIFPEVDVTTIGNEFDYSVLNGTDILSLGLKTIYGDSIYCIDVDNELMIVEVKSDTYAGKLAIVNNSEQVSIQKSAIASRGQTVTEMCKDSDSILGVNACGFADEAGCGNGSVPIGLVQSNGKTYNEAFGTGYFQIAGLDNEDNFRIGTKVDTTELRDGVQFYPILILNGQKIVQGTGGLGIQPRTVVGQTDDKRFLMLIIDGRQVGYSIGATISECADILINYGAYNAMNMDGGSSSSMTYKGQMITKTSSPAKAGRFVPTSWVVSKADA